MTRFNDLYDMVKDDRVSEKAKEMEELLVANALQACWESSARRWDECSTGERN